MSYPLHPPGKWLLALCLVANSVLAAPIDEFRISDLEQKVRELESASREQSRLIRQLEGQAGTTPASSAPIRKPASNESLWFSVANWQRVKPGMSELQIVEILGPPTQVRLIETQSNPQGRAMMYAMEIGRSGFLVGQVEVRDNKAVSIEIPRLK